MGKVVTTDKAIQIAQNLAKQGKKIVLAGGCFDILHIGHVEFLRNAKKQGDILFLLVESDETIRKMKSNNRPINSQGDRAAILESLQMVDYVIKLPPVQQNSDYDNLVISIKPAIIATTKGDVNRAHKERQANKIRAKVVDVAFPVVNRSTTRLINVLNKSL